jgi:hypothetical protein
MTIRSTAHPIILVAAIAAAAMLAALLPAQPAGATVTDSLPAAESKPDATPLRELCPGIDTQLQEALAFAARDVGIPATVHVQMRVEGGQAIFVQATGGRLEYRRLMHRAINRLTCDNTAQGSQLVSFDIGFADTEAPTIPTTLASH